MSKKVTRNLVVDFVVDRCAEFACPLYATGIMGQEWCQADPQDRSLKGNNGKPPSWCPLESGTGVVTIRARKAAR